MLCQNLYCTFAAQLKRTIVLIKKQLGMIKITNEPVAITIERPTKMLLIKQGDSQIRMTKNDVNRLQMLRDGRYDGFINSITNYRFRLQPDKKSILVTSTENTDDAVYLTERKRGGDDVVRIQTFRDNNRPRIAFDADIKHRR